MVHRAIRTKVRAIVAMLSACAFAAPVAAPVAAHDADARHLSLVDQRGARFSLADLRGRPTFVTFVATRCSDACPIANAAFGALASNLMKSRAQANLLTVTLDPDYDTPFVIAREARAFRADPRLWRFASGTPRDVRALMRAFGVVTQRNADGVPDAHTTLVYLLDARGRLARTLLLSTGFTREAARLIRTSA